MSALLVATMTFSSCTDKDAPDKSDTLEFEGTLNGAQEVPATPSGATGQMTGTYNKATKELTYNVTYTGITPIAGHIHQSPTGPGTNGPVIIPFSSLTSPISGRATLKQDQENALMEGRLYVNLHTAQFPGGEIRANIMRKPF